MICASIVPYLYKVLKILIVRRRSREVKEKNLSTSPVGPNLAYVSVIDNLFTRAFLRLIVLLLICYKELQTNTYRHS